MRKNLIFYTLMKMNVILWIIQILNRLRYQKKTAGEKFKLLKENLEVSIKFLDDKPIAIDLLSILNVSENPLKGL